MGANFITFGGRTLVDLREDTVKSETLFLGETAHGKDGEPVTGTFTLDSEISEQNVLIEQIRTALQGKAAGGATPIIQELSITENGTYEAPDGVDGYSPVMVEVPVPDGYIQPSGTLEVTENGTHDVTVFQSINVNVSGGDSDASAALSAILNRTVTSVSSDVTKIGDFAFRNCTKLVTANLPNVTSIGQYAFKYCNALKNVYVPKANTLSAYSFEDSAIQVLDLPSVTSIAANSFNGSKLSALIIRTTSQMCSLANKNAFGDTPIESGTGYIYVHKVWLSDTDATKDYRRATNWVNYSARLRAIEDYPEITGG